MFLKKTVKHRHSKMLYFLYDFVVIDDFYI